MINIVMDNVYTKLENVPKDIEDIIWNKLAFEVREYMKEYIQIRHLYNRKTKKTYTGLVEYIKEILDNYEMKYKIIDNRKSIKQNADFKLQEYINLPNGKKVKLEAREYQQKIIDDCENREIIRAATGAGKTFIMAGLIDKFKVKPVSIFADKLSLCTQLQSEIGKFLGEDVGLVGGGVNNKKDITIYSAQSVTEDDVADSNMIMFDECFPKDTLITLSNGKQKTIQEIVENQLEEELLTYNIKTNKLENKKIYNWGKKKNNKPLYRITIKDKKNNEYTIVCTEDHKIFVDGKYIQAKDLIINQKVVINQ